MKRFWAALAVISLIVGFTAGNATAEKFFPYPYEQTVLPNGLTVVLVPMDSPGMVAYYSIVRTGSRDEYEPKHSGFAHFFEHMMFRGTKNYPGPLYDKLMTEMGADANAFTSTDVTCYHIEFAVEDLDKVMELESDRFQNLSYAEDAFKTEAGAVFGEYRKSVSSPWFNMEETLLNTAFDQHTYKHTTIGFKEDVAAMPTMYDYSVSFLHRYYRPENVVLVIVGDIKAGPTLDMVKKYYGGWQRGYVPPQIPVEPEQKGERTAKVTFEGRTLPIITMAYKSIAFHPDSIAPAAAMILGELAFGETSEIHKKLVLDEQKVQFIGGDFGPSRDPNLFSVTAMVIDSNDIETVKAEVEKTIEQYQAVPVDAGRLKDVKSNLRYSYLMGLDTPGGVAGRLISILALTGNMDNVDRYYATLDRVTPDDVMAAAKRFLIKDKRTVVLVEGQ